MAYFFFTSFYLPLRKKIEMMFPLMNIWGWYTVRSVLICCFWAQTFVCAMHGSGDGGAMNTKEKWDGK